VLPSSGSSGADFVDCPGCGELLPVPNTQSPDQPALPNLELDEVSAPVRPLDLVTPLASPKVIVREVDAYRETPSAYDEEQTTPERLVLRPKYVPEPVRPRSRKKAVLAVSVIVILMVGAVTWVALRSRDAGPPAKVPLAFEVDEHRRKEVREAFDDRKPLKEEDIDRELRPFFDVLGKSLNRRDAFALSKHFNIERMVDELDAQGLMTDMIRRHRGEIIKGMRDTVGTALARQADLMNWDSYEFRNIKKLPGNEAVVIVRHRSAGGLILKMRWWVTKEGGAWQVFDMEDLDMNLRFSTNVGSIVAALRAEGKELVRGADNLREAMLALAIRQDVDGAEAKLRQIEGVKLPDPLEATRRLISGMVLLRRNQPEAALREWDNAAKIHKDMPVLNQFKGMAFNSLSRWKEAFKHLDEYQKLLGDDTLVCSEMGLCLRGLNRFAEAADSYRKALDYDPKNADAFFGLVLSLAPGAKRGDLGKRFAKLDVPHQNYDLFAQDCLQNNDPESLEELALAMTKIDAKYAPAAYHLALAKAKRFKFEEALPLFKTALTLKVDRAARRELSRTFLLAMVHSNKTVETYALAPEAQVAFQILGLELMRNFREHELGRLLTAHEEKLPGDPLAPFLRGAMLVMQQNFKEAEKSFATGMANPPDASILHEFRYNRVLARFHTGKMLPALSEIGPRSETFSQLANLCFSNSKLDDLESLLDAQTNVDPGHPNLLAFRIRVKIQRKDVPAAVALFKKSLAAEADAGKRQNLVSAFLFAMVDADRTLEGYEAAPESKAAFRQLAMDLVDFGKADELEKLLALHGKRHPDDALVVYYRGELLLDQQAWQKAAEAFWEGWNTGDANVRRLIGPRYEFAMFQAGKAIESYAKTCNAKESFTNLAYLLVDAKKGTELDALIQKHRPNSADDGELLYFEARAKAMRKQPVEAIALIRHACEKTPTDLIRRQRVTDWTLDMAYAGQAMPAYRAAPDKSAAFESLAHRWLLQKKEKELAALLEEHLKTHPDDPMRDYFKGELHFLRGDFAKAEQVFATALAGPDSREAIWLPGGLYRARIKLGQTVRTYEEFGPGKAVFESLASYCVSSKNPEELQALLDAYDKKNPDEANHAIWEVEILFLKSDYDAALDLLRKNKDGLFSKVGYRAKAISKVVRSLINLKKNAEAIREAEDAHKKRTVDSITYVLAYAAAGDVKKTIDVMQRNVRDRFFVEDCYCDSDLGPLLRSDAFAEFRKRWPPPKDG